MPRAWVYVLMAIGLFGAVVMSRYSWSYLSDVGNPLRDEYQIGMALSVLYFGAFWIAAPAVAVAARGRLRRLEVVITFLPLLVAVASCSIAVSSQ